MNLARSLFLRLRHLRHGAQGLAAIEFAIVLPVFMLFLIFIIEYGLMMFGNAVIRDMVTQTAHLSMIGCLDGEFGSPTSTNCNGTVYNRTQLISEIKSRSLGLVKADDCSLFKLSAVPSSGINSTGANCSDTWDQGQGNEVRAFKASYKWPVFFSWLNVLGIFNNTVNFQTVTIVRNEPFGAISNR